MDELHEKERIKYEKIWDIESYGHSSPGEKFFKRAFKEMKCRKGETLMDWGIGIGRAAQLFQDAGLEVEGFDIARNANQVFKGTVHIGTLWNPKLVNTYAYGYCTDVMEHIPEERVINVLRYIKKHTEKCCWFSIATYPDKSGALIEDVLHMTVKQAKWWAMAFAKVFPRFVFEDDGKRIIVVAYSKRR